MKNIGTISLNINTHDLNYGAMLHSWAFQQFLLKRYDCDTQIIDYTIPKYYGMNLKYSALEHIKKKRPKAAIIALQARRAMARRYDKFENFKKTNMHISKESYSNETLESAELPYDTIICESDVIWAPHFFDGAFEETFFLNRPAMANMKKIAYAPSAGNLEFDDTQKKAFKELINGLDYISCRESYLADYINSFSEKKATHVLDPVMLLSADDYAGITAKRRIKEPYVLFYMPAGYDKKLIKTVDSYAKDRGLQVIEISRFAFDNFYHKTFVDAGIEDFLSLIAGADTVISNSFHAVCFSVIFQKPFFAFSRKTGKKTEDICRTLGADKAYLYDYSIPKWDIDYSVINDNWERMKEKSVSFLDEALKGD